VSTWRRLTRFRCFAIAVLALACSTTAGARDWPQEVTAEEGTIVVYQPQPESLEGNVLKGRAAMSLEMKGQSEPIFGAFWFEAKIDTNKENGSAFIRDVRVTNVRWPESNDAQEQRFTTIVEAAIPQTGFEISMERLSASLDTARIQRESLAELKNDPPQILFRDELSVLLLYDGKPHYIEVEKSGYERIVNTPLLVVRRTGSSRHYLSNGRFWYEADDPMGPWVPTSSPPADLVKMLPAPEDGAEDGPSTPPAIVTASEPTEVISTQGGPDWQAVEGGELLYVKNTETPWLRELSTGNMYVLLSGRWFRAKSTEGPWTFVRGDELPASFAEIPPASAIGGLRTFVAGTPEAEDAVLDAHVPQTAAIKRSEAKLSVQYDGEPKFEKIPGTKVSYALNTGTQVLEIEGRYYAVDAGVWFVASSATGPWVVADSIPEEEIQKIPPSSPAYNTTYVHIYESTPEVVYVGYTPGYMWSFPYYGVPVYGSGWYYPPYYGGGWYYPRPPTWGFHVGYNPWTGWTFGLSWTNGFFSFGVAWGGGYAPVYRPGGCCGGWYGGGYHGPVFINNGDINIGNSIGDRNDLGNRIDHHGARDLDRARTNIYDRPENRARNADRATATQNLREARPATNRANDVFADRDGNVARRSGDQWQTRDNGQWRDSGLSTSNLNRSSSSSGYRTTDRAGTRPSTSQFDRSGLNRDYSARQRGMSRQMSRPRSMRAPMRRR